MLSRVIKEVRMKKKFGFYSSIDIFRYMRITL